MGTSIQSFIEMCQWDTTRFLIISNNVFDPLIYYSHLVPLIVSFILGIFIFARSHKLLISKVLLGTILLLDCWLFADLVVWATNAPSITMFSWSLVNMVEPIIYAGVVYFLYLFIDQKDISLNKKIFIGILLLPTIILTPTKFALKGFDLTNCDRDAIEGILAYYSYFVEILFIIWILFFGIKRFLSTKDREVRQKIFFISIGSLGFLTAFAFGNIIGSLFDTYSIGGEYSWTIGQYGLFGIPIFLAFLTYMIVRFKIFNIKLLGAQALVFALGFLVLAISFLKNIQSVRVVVAITLLLVIILGYALVKSVKKEVKQREELEVLLRQRESLVHLITHKVKGSFTRTKLLFAGMLDGTFGDITPEIKKRAEQGLEFDNNGIQTVNLVLNVANIQNGLIKYDMKPLNFRELVEQTASEKKIQSDAKGLKLESEIKDGNYNTVGDSVWLKEAVNNLIDNSIKYTKAGSIKVELERKEKNILLSVKDTGVGITEEDKKNLFTEGGRGKDSVKVNVDSTGYGLFTVKLIIDAHKGRVWAESAGADKGSQFYIELPTANTIVSS